MSDVPQTEDQIPKTPHDIAVRDLMNLNSFQLQLRSVYDANTCNAADGAIAMALRSVYDANTCNAADGAIAMALLFLKNAMDILEHSMCKTEIVLKDSGDAGIQALLKQRKDLTKDLQ